VTPLADLREHPFEVLDQAKVADLHMVEEQEDVLRLDVEVLQIELHVHQVEGLGGFLEVAQQLRARDAGQALGLALLKAVEQRAVGKLADDDQAAIDDVEAFERQDIW